MASRSGATRGSGERAPPAAPALPAGDTGAGLEWAEPWGDVGAEAWTWEIEAQKLVAVFLFI